MDGELDTLIESILQSGDSFLGGIHARTTELMSLLTAVRDWSKALRRPFAEVAAVVEPCIRQSILMSLIPVKGIDPDYSGSIDRAIGEHLETLKISLDAKKTSKLRDICINMRKLQGLDSRSARRASMSLGQLKIGSPAIFGVIVVRQNNRCIWCGVSFDARSVSMTLEHMAPKHIGNDVYDGSNWALACGSCNEGKGDALAWSANPAAHDYFRRSDFNGRRSIPLTHRWSVLVRNGSCDNCKAGPRENELLVYRRITTGLAIPANCSTTCVSCAAGKEVLAPLWCNKEGGRTECAGDLGTRIDPAS